MAKTTDKFVLVSLIGGHFHAAHLDHFAVEFHELIFGNGELVAWWIDLVAIKRIFA